MRLRNSGGFSSLGNEAVNLAHKATNPFNSGILPVEVSVRRSSEEAIETGGISAVACHHVVRRDDVAETLGHLGAIFDHRALGEQALGRLIVRYQSHVAHEFGP